MWKKIRVNRLGFRFLSQVILSQKRRISKARCFTLFSMTFWFLSVLINFQFIVLNSLHAADSVTKIAKKISAGAKSLKNKKVAVLPFPYHDGRESKGSTIVSERLITKLVEQKKLEVVERSLLEKVFSELKLQSSGAIDEQSAKQLGKVLGVEAIVSGTLIDLGEQEVEVNARLIQAESGQILVAASGKVERFWKEELAAQPAQTTYAKSSPSQEPKDDLPKQMAQAQVLPPGEQKLPPLSHPTDEPPAKNAPLHFSNQNELRENPKGRQPEMEPLPQEMELNENEVLGGPADLLLFETDLGHERESSFGQQMTQGLVALKNGQAEKAEEIFNRLKENRDHPKMAAVAHLGLSISLFQQGKKEKAFRLAQEVVHHTRAMPRVNAVAHFVLGRYAEKLGEPDAARENYLQVVRTSPFQSLLVRTAGRRLRNLEGEERQEKIRERVRERMQERREMRRERRER